MKRLPRHKKLARRARLRSTAHRHRRTGGRTITVYDNEDEPGSGHLEKKEMSLDRYDISEGLTIAKKTANWLLDEGVYEASSSAFHQGVWYNTEPQQDFRTGEYESRSYHLKGFSSTEERDIFNLITRRR